MTDKDVTHSVASDLATAMTPYSVAPASLDGVSDLKETRWQNKDWTQWNGYYNDIPELGVIDTKARWTIGKGFKADEETTMLLDTIKGNGFDTFNTILENCVRVYHVGGDSYCEKIRDDEGNLINLKPMDPEGMVHILNDQGMFIRFEQTSKIVGNEPKKFTPDEIFYLARNRIGDQIHGTSMVKKLVNIILARNEALADWKKVLHRNIAPLLIFKLDTDNEVKIATIKAKVDAAKGGFENLYMPQGSAEVENITVAPNSTLNALSTIEAYNNYFYEAAGVPRFIVGGQGGITERAVSISYLAFQQTIEEEQLFIEEQVLSQLNLVIELNFPASLQNDLLSDQQKDGAMNIDQSETTASEERA